MNNPSSQACGLDLESFKPSTITLVEGPSKFVPDLLLYLCAHTADRHQQDAVFVDGGNSFNPYTLRSISKVLQADIKTVMTKTHVARAFTEYQMNDLLTQQLPPVIQKYQPRLLAVAYLPHLFDSPHSHRLLKQAVEHLKEYTRTHGLTTVVTSYGGTWWGAGLVEECACRVIRVVQHRKLLRMLRSIVIKIKTLQIE
ncbi:MAG: hypothetical protein HF976_13955 [ANME-2 cluster archaeon]|nr:hypothetical protein [ANME-2 cluster archaeon]MBC2702481.1 hypothetical protein [ANME-2 cluster archaeon]MBC2707941.1 hypothetical protein [ANME-2 cluster archaeon]MBC2747027.1 hypothetical protein [ANME-2 cluster archaeon]MBC2762926.1 hypothetical protein [ANME-2 cluster archaeon]